MRPLQLTSDPTGPSSADMYRTAESRLRRVCAGWPEDRFATLVADVVRFHQRWDAWDARPRRPRAGHP